MLPKLALFAATINELQNELRPAVESALSELGVPLDRILVNVGDEKLTSNDELREFINLDTRASEKQFILLVNKGKEGWNCRSLFGVALYRKPKSKIFVLQASMRCLRQIGEGQQTGHIYLSEENTQILDDELQQNFRVSVEEIRSAGVEKAWNASFRLLARGGFMVTAAIDSGEVAFVELESRLGETCQMRNPWPGACRVIELEGDTHELDGEILRFDTEPGKRYQVLPKGKPQPAPRRISPRPTTEPLSYSLTMPNGTTVHEGILGRRK